MTYSMARACASGALFHCTCATPPHDPPSGNFKWGGCGDNVRWGAQFAKQFVDSIERNEGRAAKRDLEEKQEETPQERKMKRIKAQLSAMNLHNNRVGRRVSFNVICRGCLSFTVVEFGHVLSYRLWNKVYQSSASVTGYPALVTSRHVGALCPRYRTSESISSGGSPRPWRWQADGWELASDYFQPCRAGIHRQPINWSILPSHRIIVRRTCGWEVLEPLEGKTMFLAW